MVGAAPCFHGNTVFAAQNEFHMYKKLWGHNKREKVRKYAPTGSELWLRQRARCHGLIVTNVN